MSTNNQPDTSFLYELARERDTTELVGYLRRGERPVIRRRAAELLGDFDDIPQEARQEEVTQALIEAVEQDDDDGVRAKAIDALYQHGTDSLERLVGTLSNVDMSATSDRMTVETLLGWLDSEYPEFRMVAATALGELGDERVASNLVDATGDVDPRVRARAVRSLGQVGNDQCVPHLQDRLGDDYERVQEAAATALGSLGTEQALEALVPAVTASDNEAVRRIAVEELGASGSLKPLVVLVRALDDRSDRVKRAAMLSLLRLVVQTERDRTEQIRTTIADQLRGLDDAVVLPPLIDIYEETTRTVIQWHALWLLARVPSEYREDVVDCLLDALDSEHESIIEAATDGLRRLAEESDELENRLRIFVQNGAASEAAITRAQVLVDELAPEAGSEVVTNSVDVTYVREPADYTARHSDENDEPSEQGE
ncbi:MAG: HEAT repeat domain-containing protein [Salinirussus sp.]